MDSDNSRAGLGDGHSEAESLIGSQEALPPTNFRSKVIDGCARRSAPHLHLLLLFFDCGRSLHQDPLKVEKEVVASLPVSANCRRSASDNLSLTDYLQDLIRAAQLWSVFVEWDLPPLPVHRRLLGQRVRLRSLSTRGVAVPSQSDLQPFLCN